MPSNFWFTVSVFVFFIVGVGLGLHIGWFFGKRSNALRAVQAETDAASWAELWEIERQIERLEIRAGVGPRDPDPREIGSIVLSVPKPHHHYAGLLARRTALRQVLALEATDKPRFSLVPGDNQKKDEGQSHDTYP